jgi:beta-glucosidase-like glycosyl hydrolase
MSEDSGKQQGLGMQCVLCQAEIPPLTGGSGTRIVAVDGVGFAACAKHFPADGASEAEYEAAYERFIRAAYERFIRAAVQAMEDLVPGASLFAAAPVTGPGHGDS